MAEIQLNDFIEVDDAELATGMSIDTTQLEDTTVDKTEDKDETKTTQTPPKEENLLDVSDEEIASASKEVESSEKELIENDEEDTNPFQAFTSLLKDKGVFPNIEAKDLDGVNDADAIIELLNKQIGVVNNSWKDNYTKNLVQNLLKDGVIKQEQLTNNTKRLTAKDITGNEDNAKHTLRQYYSSKNIPDSQVQTIIDGILDHEEEALKVLPQMEEDERLKSEALTQKYKAQEEEELAQQNTFNETLKKTVYDYKDFIPGRTLTDGDKQEVFESIPNVLDKINKDLGKYAPILALLNRYDMLDGNMDKLIKEAETKNVDAFTKVLTSKKRGSTTNTRNPNRATKLSGNNIPQIYR